MLSRHNAYRLVVHGVAAFPSDHFRHRLTLRSPRKFPLLLFSFLQISNSRRRISFAGMKYVALASGGNSRSGDSLFVRFITVADIAIVSPQFHHVRVILLPEIFTHFEHRPVTWDDVVSNSKNLKM